MKNVLLITNIPTPYHIPLFIELNRQLKELGIEFKALLFGARGYARRKWIMEEKELSIGPRFHKNKTHIFLYDDYR